MKRVWSLLLVFGLLLGVLTGCGESTQKEKKDTLTIMGMIATEDLNPLSGGVGRDPNLMESIYGSLVKYDENGEIVPGMVSWTIADDGITRNFTLKEGIKFQDGSDLTAEDVVFTLDKMKEDQMLVYSVASYTWEKTGDLTFSITPATPISNPVALMSTTQVVPSDSFDAETFRTAPIGAGPYKLASIETDGTVKLEAFANYYEGAPYFQNLVIKAPLEASAAVIALQNGEVDVLPNAAPGQLPLIKEDKALSVIEDSGFVSTGIWFYGEIKDDINLKLAISYAIDREKMIQIACDGSGTAAKDLISAKTLGSLAGSVSMPGYDLEKAKDYLAKSEYQSGEVLTLTITSESAEAQCIKDDLKAIGVEVEIRTLDWNSLYQEIMNQTIGMTIMSNGASVATAAGLLRNFTTENADDLLCTDEYDQLVDQIRSTTDDGERNELCKKALQIQAELVNVAPLYEANGNICFMKGITGLSDYSAVATYLYTERLGMED